MVLGKTVACCLHSKADEQNARSKNIEKMLLREKTLRRREVGVLLLGAGESGKSTFLKQMKIIHGIMFTDDELQFYKTLIYENILKAMKVLCCLKIQFGFPWEASTSEQNSNSIMRLDLGLVNELSMFPEFKNALVSLWEDASIQKTYTLRRLFHLGDSLEYYMANLGRIAERGYIPSNNDILYARKATKGICDFVIPINNVPFRFVDVGGQRSQRQKWLQCFSDINAILFLVSSSEYDQVLVEDRKTNRLVESRIVFDTIVNNNMFRSKAIMLFFNKTDLLLQKLSKRDSNIKINFPEFAGNPYDLNSVQLFMKNYFLSVIRSSTKSIYLYYTTIVDTENTKIVFEVVKQTILQSNLEELMLQ